jgi:hypothetical protein
MLDDDVGRMPHRRCSVQIWIPVLSSKLVAVGKEVPGKERENLLLLGMKRHS